MDLQRLRGKWWLVIGTVAYVATALSSIVRSLEPMPFGDFLYLVVDWLAACVVYFFLGALLGHIVDAVVARKLKQRIAYPDWFWLTLALWAGGSLLVALTSEPGSISPLLIIIFPLAFGIFFNGGAFAMLFPSFVQHYLYGKLLLDVLYLGAFVGWLWLVLTKKAVLLRRVLLVVVFGILFLGVVSCARTFS